MTVEDKIQVLIGIFRQNSNRDVLTWGSVDNGYRWTCSSNTAALHFATSMLEFVTVLGLDVATFPFRVDGTDECTVTFEPIADDVS